MWHINAGPTFAIACFNGAWRSIQTSDGNILLIRGLPYECCSSKDSIHVYIVRKFEQCRLLHI